MKLAGTALERVLVVVVALVVTIGAIAALSGFFAGRDQAGVSGAGGGPGESFADLGHAHLRPGQLRPVYNSDPPTSGAHLPVPVPVLRDGAELNDDQLLQALEHGNVVFVYGTHRAPPGLSALARSIAGPFSPALAAAGQAVILARRSGTTGLIGLAWAHEVRVSAPNDQLLGAFAQYWLGRGAPGR
ncbi:MAG TPA: DUF3105 domain-containing protein [Solirubrobacteraceae bacterium]|nr:DUF3105 domain-containing protein [Solirubrobacteraceae bacterium]